MKAFFDKIGDAIGDGFLTLLWISILYFPVVICFLIVLMPFQFFADYMGWFDLNYDLDNLFGMLFFLGEDMDTKCILSNLLYFVSGCFLSGFFISLGQKYFDCFSWNRDDL